MSWWNYPTVAGPSQALSGVNPRSDQRQSLALPIFLFLAPLFHYAPGFRFVISVLRFQLSAFQLFASCPSVGIQFGHGEKLIAGLFDGVFHPQPVEQRALGLLLAGCDSDQAPKEMGANGRSAAFHPWSRQPMV
jgi:hypothetical protein